MTGFRLLSESVDPSEDFLCLLLTDCDSSHISETTFNLHITNIIVSITKFLIWLVPHAPICDIISTESHGHPITDIHFEQIQIGYLHLDTYAIRAYITYTKMGSFLLFSCCLYNQFDIHVPFTFSHKRGSQRLPNLNFFYWYVQLIGHGTSCCTIQGYHACKIILF